MLLQLTTFVNYVPTRAKPAPVLLSALPAISITREPTILHPYYATVQLASTMMVRTSLASLAHMIV